MHIASSQHVKTLDILIQSALHLDPRSKFMLPKLKHHLHTNKKSHTGCNKKGKSYQEGQYRSAIGVRELATYQRASPQCLA